MNRRDRTWSQISPPTLRRFMTTDLDLFIWGLIENFWWHRLKFQENLRIPRNPTLRWQLSTGDWFSLNTGITTLPYKGQGNSPERLGLKAVPLLESSPDHPFWILCLFSPRMEDDQSKESSNNQKMLTLDCVLTLLICIWNGVPMIFHQDIHFINLFIHLFNAGTYIGCSFFRSQGLDRKEFPVKETYKNDRLSNVKGITNVTGKRCAKSLSN